VLKEQNMAWTKLPPRPIFILAPMDDVTDTVFRQVVAKCAPPDLFFTEFVNVDGLQSPGRPKLIQKLQFTKSEKPIVAQVWGLNPDNFHKTAQEIVAMGFAGLDLNFGCPVKEVVRNGACSALMNNRELAVKIIEATKAGLDGRLPLSVKTRLGFNEFDLSWHELLLKQNLDMLTIHGRTRKEMSKVPAHWDKIGEIRQLRDQLAVKTLIVGNGDVQSRAQGLELAEKYQLDGIMIGRGIFNDPFVFAEKSAWNDFTKEQKIELYKSHIELFDQTWSNHEKPVKTLNKFCKVYINGFAGAKELREQLMTASTTEDLLNKLSQIT
jgi:tRNA-dihydrouridine synthase